MTERARMMRVQVVLDQKGSFTGALALGRDCQELLAGCWQERPGEAPLLIQKKSNKLSDGKRNQPPRISIINQSIRLNIIHYCSVSTL